MKKHKKQKGKVRQNEYPDRSHKVKTGLKFAPQEERIYVDRPKKLRPDPIIVDVEGFREDFAALCARYMKKLKSKEDRLLGMCQLQDATSIFSPWTADRIKEILKKSV